MFNFERDFSSERPIARATQAAEQTLEQRQRDIFESHRHRAFSLAFYMTGNELEAEEILASTFIRAFEQQEQPDAFAVDHALLEELGERFPLSQKPHEASALAASPGLSLGGRNVLRTDLETAVRSLPPRERLLFLLRDVEGYPLETIGSLLGIGRAEAERALFSSRVRLRQNLAACARRAPEAA